MRILLVAPNRSSFIHLDYQNLKADFETDFVTCWNFSQILSTLKKVRNNDICFFWFASIRFTPVFLLAKALSKKTIVIAGGYDVSWIPDIDYGGIKPWNFFSFLRKLILHFSDRVITVSNSNTIEAIQNACIPENKIERIYLGLDKPNIKLKAWSERKNQVVFIACCDRTSYKIKGFETFLALAKAMPDITFIHVGRIQVLDFQKKCYETSNIRTMGFVENMSSVFSDLLNDSKIILLPSRIESFGVSILEGGLHGCFPIVSDSYSLPEIIGKTGLVCKHGDIYSFVNAIQETIRHYQNVLTIQDHFSSLFSTKIRKESLIKVIRSFF